MALAKKGTRLMTVEGARYRWVVAPNDEPGLGIVVEAADSPGQRMVTWVDHGTTISPWLVREAILHALAHGWQSQARGPERVFRFDAPSIRLGEGLGCRSEWVDLIKCLKPTDRKLLPPRLRTLAANQIESEFARNPARRE